MSIIERSNVTGTFTNRLLAEEAVVALREAGFSDQAIGLAGQLEVREKLQGHSMEEASEPATAHHELVSLAVHAEERWQEALTILLQHGATNPTPTAETLRENISDLRQLAGTTTGSAGEEHLEYDPITGPRVVLEEGEPIASGPFGLERDPALDTEEVESNSQNNTATPESNADTFFGPTSHQTEQDEITHIH
jgi:hypothetical protein